MEINLGLLRQSWIMLVNYVCTLFTLRIVLVLMIRYMVTRSLYAVSCCLA